ncbi:MAG: TetR/AcrR family transcriptional regulator [Firmicutes bacterium HGW-Firmicutes-10]|jgi:AcrR family transcriptional regulator|nr:MAG: TetR/AcrR family transcriptional regulator [Firmicutes bacterium HGW-Firmicutes-10]
MREKQDQHQSQLIINAAYKHISQRGYANVSLREIADEAGVVLSQLNYYYKNKEGLLIEVVRMTARQYMVEIEEILKRGTSSQARMINLVKYFQDMLITNPNLFRLLFDLTNMSMWSSTFRNLLNELFDDLANLIEEYVLTDNANFVNISNTSNKTLAQVIFGSLFGTSIQIILNPENKDLIQAMNIVEAIYTTN